MVRDDVLCTAGVDEETLRSKAAQVGADILSEYRQLARKLRARGWDEAAAMAATLDPTARASRQCALNLYGTAASELDDVIADLLNGLECPSTGTEQPPTLRVIDGGRAGSVLSDGSSR